VTEVPSWVQGRSPGMGFGGRSPPEAEVILDLYMHNFDRILYYFCFARATDRSIRHFIYKQQQMSSLYIRPARNTSFQYASVLLTFN